MEPMAAKIMNIPMTNEEYHAAPGISASSLKLLEESPRHLENAALFKKTSDAMDIGTFFHAAILEPETIHQRFKSMPKFDLRTNAGKAAAEQFKNDNAGFIHIPADVFDNIDRVAQNVRSIAGGILTGGVAEQSFFADDDGLTLKCRPDYYIESAGLVVDLKKVADISEYGIKKSIANYRYDRQNAHYLRTLRIGGMPARTFLFVFIEESAPHMVKVRALEESAIAAADYEIETMLEGYREYLKTGKASMIKTIKPFENRV